MLLSGALMLFNMKEYQQIVHPLAPVWNSESKILILGTMPSPKSREESFYYAHPRNRFWQIMSKLFDQELTSVQQKTDFLLNNHIALWDVLYSCDIISAADSTIKNPVANDISGIIKKSSISAVFTTGSTAFRLYNQLLRDNTGIDAVCLPSTSPANARMSFDELLDAYSVILRFI